MNYTIIVQYGPHPAMTDLYRYDNGYKAETIYNRMCQANSACTHMLLFKGEVLRQSMGTKSFKINTTVDGKTYIFAP